MQKTEANARDSYKLYKQISEAPILDKPYLDIVGGYRAFLVEKALEGEEVTLPARMGTLSFRGRKAPLKFDSKGVPKLPPDWKATLALWERNPEAKLTKKLVFCTNEHTGGVVYKFSWSKNRVPIENKTLYSLRMTKTHKNEGHHTIKSGREFLVRQSN